MIYPVKQKNFLLTLKSQVKINLNLLFLYSRLKGLLDFNNYSAPHATFEDGRKRIGQFIQRHFAMNNIFKVAGPVIGCQMVPELAAQFHRSVSGLDAKHVDAAQDKRKYSRVQAGAPGIATDSY